jgi:hypothetical protein
MNENLKEFGRRSQLDTMEHKILKMLWATFVLTHHHPIWVREAVLIPDF